MGLFTAWSRKQVLQEKTLAKKVTAGIFPWITISEIEIGRQISGELRKNIRRISGGSSPELQRWRWLWLLRGGKLSSERSGQSTSCRLINFRYLQNVCQTHVFSSKSRRNLCWNAFMSSEVCLKCFCWC